MAILWFILSGNGAVICAQEVDTATIKKWIDSAWQIRFDDPSLSMTLAYQALAESRDVYYFGKLNGLQLLGEGYYSLGKLDSAILVYSQALKLSLAKKDIRETGNNYTSLASIYQDKGERDSSLLYCQLAIDRFEQARDSFSLCDALLRYGNVFNVMGRHGQAISTFMQSIRICEAIHRDLYIAYNYGSIGIIHDKQANYKTAEEYFLKALDIFTDKKDWYGQMGIYNNLGIMYKNMHQFQKSFDVYQQSLVIADSVQFGRGQLSAHTNLGILNVEMKFFENGLHHSQLGLELAKAFEDKEAVADNLNWIARAQLGLQDYLHSEQNAKEALQIGREVQSLEKQRDANLTLSQIFEGQRDFDQSLHFYKAYTEIRDSLYTEEKSKQISELQTVYETEKKDKEIQLLAKNAEIDRMRKTRLWIAFGLSLLAGSLLVYSQWIRRSRDKKILSQEKELEIQRRHTAELKTESMSRELDFKKRELTAKALQLARKNEFLQSLHEQIDHLRENKEGVTDDSARRLSRQIRMDIESEEDWEHFLSSFREVHRDFIDQLQLSFPSISRSELRLACLMKMNLSAKELAALLNITPEGIKKARYRLRKKLDLDSSLDIQEFLLAFPN